MRNPYTRFISYLESLPPHIIWRWFFVAIVLIDGILVWASLKLLGAV